MLCPLFPCMTIKVDFKNISINLTGWLPHALIEPKTIHPELDSSCIAVLVSNDNHYVLKIEWCCPPDMIFSRSFYFSLILLIWRVYFMIFQLPNADVFFANTIIAIKVTLIFLVSPSTFMQCTLWHGCFNKLAYICFAYFTW